MYKCTYYISKFNVQKSTVNKLLYEMSPNGHTQ